MCRDLSRRVTKRCVREISDDDATAALPPLEHGPQLGSGPGAESGGDEHRAAPRIGEEFGKGGRIGHEIRANLHPADPDAFELERCERGRAQEARRDYAADTAGGERLGDKAKSLSPRLHQYRAGWNRERARSGAGRECGEFAAEDHCVSPRKRTAGTVIKGAVGTEITAAEITIIVPFIKEPAADICFVYS